MQENLRIVEGCVKSRERALRLVRRVAAAIDDLEELPTDEKVIELSTAHTIHQCTT